MKKSLILVFFLIIIGLVSASSEVPTSPDIVHIQNKAIINVVSYDPIPVSAGNYFDLHVRLQNLDGTDISAVNLQVVEEFPFSIYSGNNGQEISELRKNQQVLLNYRIKVDDKALSGENDLRLRYVTPKGVWMSDPLKITVGEIESSLAVDAVKLEPPILKQGEVGKVTITLHNYAASYVKDVTLGLNIDNIDVFVPVSSTTEKKVRSLSVGETKDVTFDLMVSADAQSKAYKVPLEITYYGSSGDVLTIKDYVGLLVGAKPDYRLDIEDAQVHTKGEAGEVVVSISNVGASEMKYVALELQDTDDYDVVSSNRVQLGNLGSDDFETGQFKIYTKTSKDFPLKVNVIYNDAYNQRYVESNDVALKMFSSGEAVKYGLDQKSGSFFSVIFVLIGLFFVYRVYKRWRIDKDIEEAVKFVLRQWYKWIKSKVLLIKERRFK